MDTSMAYKMSIFAVKMVLEKDGFEEIKATNLFFCYLFKISRNVARAFFLIKKVQL